jgi:hypothetical protein
VSWEQAAGVPSGHELWRFGCHIRNQNAIVRDSASDRTGSRAWGGVCALALATFPATNGLAVAASSFRWSIKRG